MIGFVNKNIFIEEINDVIETNTRIEMKLDMLAEELGYRWENMRFQPVLHHWEKIKKKK